MIKKEIRWLQLVFIATFADRAIDYYGSKMI